MLKNRLSHPPNPGAPRRAFTHASFSIHRNPQQEPSRLTTRQRAQTWWSLFAHPTPREYASSFDSPAALLDKIFEHPRIKKRLPTLLFLSNPLLRQSGATMKPAFATCLARPGQFGLR